MSELGRLLKQKRKELKVTQRDLAARVGVDFTYISKIENDRLEHTPSESTLVKIANELGLNPSELVLLAKKVPEAIRATVFADDLAAGLLRVMSDLTPAEREQIEAIVERRKK